MERLRLGVLVSGRGSNLQSIIDACKEPDFPAKIAIVISNRPDAYALTRASAADIPTRVIDHQKFESREAFENALQKIFQEYPVDIICLAGFMRILTKKFVDLWPEKIINIHPSLLPKYKGLHTHARAIEAKDLEAGCTVHYVIPEMDEGPIIIQKKIRIDGSDTAESLAEKVLEAEHQAYPEAIRTIATKILNTSLLK